MQHEIANALTVDNLLMLFRTTEGRNYKVPAIKRVRELTGLGLRDAKEIVDSAAVDPDYTYTGPLPHIVYVEKPTLPAFMRDNLTTLSDEWQERINAATAEMNALLRVLRLTETTEPVEQSAAYYTLHAAIEHLYRAHSELHYLKQANALPPREQRQ